MRYLLNRNGWYFYDRRVPKCFAKFDSRTRVRVSLHTRCQMTAVKKLIAINDNIESEWQGMSQIAQSKGNIDLKHLVRTAHHMGFDYKPVDQVAELPLMELIERILKAQANIDQETKIKAILGTNEQQTRVLLSEALERFWRYSKPVLVNKNPDQQRKWKNPRKRAVKNFINVVGNKEIQAITNLDLVKFRDWWLDRINNDGVCRNSANKNFSCLRSIIETVSDHEELSLEVDKMFKKIHLKEIDKGQRSAYSTEFIQHKIFNNDALKKLNEEARCIMMVCANTGARPIEVVNLIKQDIVLDAPVPYIHIRPRKGYSLKTKESERKIPLIGEALEAFKAYPEGFNTYGGSSERVSACINKWLKNNGLRPTPKHSLYSFRHSFQDRLTALEKPDRIQCQLMGHKYKRPKYGSGADLEHLQKVMKEVNVV